MRIPSGTTDQYIYFVAVDATDFTTRETGLDTFTVYASKDGAAAAAFTTPTVNETDSSNMPGVYELLLDEQTTLAAGNDTEELCLHITHAGMAPVTRTIELYRPKITVGNTLTVEADGDLAVVTLCRGNTDMRGTNSAATAANLATMQGNVTSILEDTGTTLDNAISGVSAGVGGVDSKVTIIDGIVDTIAINTGTNIPATLAGMSGAGFVTGTDSLVALRDRGDAAWLTATGFATPTNVTDAVTSIKGTDGDDLKDISDEIAGLNNLSAGDVTGAVPTAAEIRTEIDSNSTQLAAIVADTSELQTDDIPSRLTGIEGATFDTSTDSLEAIRNRGDSAWTGGGGAGGLWALR